MTDHHDETAEKKKRSSADSAAQRTENMTSGEILRRAREKKKLTLDDVASAIHVRPAQLKAIEEGNIDALPGMTYAVGFVKSYAGYLKLNAIELGNKFKTEHGALKPVMPDLPQPQPIVESRMPDPMVVGVAGLVALVLLLGWAFFAGDKDDTTLTAAATAPVPALDMSEKGLLEDEMHLDENGVTDMAASVQADDDLATAPVAETEAPVEVQPPAAETPAVTESSTPSEESTPTQAAATSETAGSEAALPARKPTPEELAAAQQEAEVINIRNPGRVVLTARQPSWIQVTGPNDRVTFRGLLQPGERYTVPDKGGYTLITTNAGGLNVTVDGKQAPSLGKAGEILRGQSLSPDDLTRPRRIRSRINN